MKQKIKEALQQAYKNLGLNDEAFEGVATFGETLGINDESLANFVKGAEGTLKKMQSDADKVRNATAMSTKQVEDLKAKLADAEAKLNTLKGGEGKKQEPTQPDFAQLISDAVTAAVQPLQDKLAAFEGAKHAEDAFKLAKDNFFGNDYAKKYTKERDFAWKLVEEFNEATGKKMTAEELQVKAMNYFKPLVADKGVDIEKPFGNEGGNQPLDFSEDVKILEGEGLLTKNNN